MRPRSKTRESYDPFHPDRYYEQAEQVPPDNYEAMVTPSPSINRVEIEKYSEANGVPRPDTCWDLQLSADCDSHEVDNGDEDEDELSPALQNTFQRVPTIQHYLACTPTQAAASPVPGTGGVQEILAKFKESQLASKESYDKLISGNNRDFCNSQPAYGKVQYSYRNGAEKQESLTNPLDNGHQSIENARNMYKTGPRSKSAQSSNTTTNRSNVFPDNLRQNYDSPIGAQTTGHHFPVMASGTPLVAAEKPSAAIAKPWEKTSKIHNMAHDHSILQPNRPRHNSDENTGTKLMAMTSRPSSLDQYERKSGERKVDRWSPVHRQSNGSHDKESIKSPSWHQHDSGYGSARLEQISQFPHDTLSDIKDFEESHTWSKHSSGAGHQKCMPTPVLRPGSGSDGNEFGEPIRLHQYPSLADIKRSRNGSLSTQGVVAYHGGAWDPAAYHPNGKRNSTNSADKKQQTLKRWVDQDYPPPEIPSQPFIKSDSSTADDESTKVAHLFGGHGPNKPAAMDQGLTFLWNLNALSAQCEIIRKCICNLRILSGTDRVKELIKRKPIDSGVVVELKVLHKKILATIDVLNHIEHPFEGLDVKRINASFGKLINDMDALGENLCALCRKHEVAWKLKQMKGDLAKVLEVIKRDLPRLVENVERHLKPEDYLNDERYKNKIKIGKSYSMVQKFVVAWEKWQYIQPVS